MEIFRKYDYYDEQYKGICEWVRLLQRIDCDQKIRVFIEGSEEPEYEGTVLDVTFIQLENLADYGSGGIVNIAAKDDVLIITLQDGE